MVHPAGCFEFLTFRRPVVPSEKPAGLDSCREADGSFGAIGNPSLVMTVFFFYFFFLNILYFYRSNSSYYSFNMFFLQIVLIKVLTVVLTVVVMMMMMMIITCLYTVHAVENIIQ